MEEREYIIMDEVVDEIVTPKEIVYESNVVAQTEEINEVAVEENIYEAAVIPEVPKVIGEEQLYVYVSPLSNEDKAKVEEIYHKLDEFKNSIPSKTSVLENDGDGKSPFATQDYVEKNGGKIDSISVGGVEQTIDGNKNVNLEISKEAVGLSNVNNTSDKDKPISDAQQEAFNNLQNEINNEKSNRETVINEIKAIIPNQASTQNQLADKDFVNSSIETATAVFKGTYTDLNILKGIQADRNDYAFYDHYIEGNRTFDKYKYNGTEWLYEYSLNNSSFTDAQWKAINSGATAELINQILINQASIEALQSSKANQTDLDTTNKTVSTMKTKLDGIETGAQKNPTNYVTTNTAQNITSEKKFNIRQDIYTQDHGWDSLVASIIPSSKLDDNNVNATNNAVRPILKLSSQILENNTVTQTFNVQKFQEKDGTIALLEDLENAGGGYIIRRID